MTENILIASGNAHKIQEIKAIVPHISFLSPKDMGIDIDPEENANNFLGNALLKARAYYTVAGGCTVLAEDSGICVDALDGRPGIYSARYGKDDPEEQQHIKHFQCNRLLREMHGINNRTARFICCAVLMISEYNFKIYQAAWEGEISHELRGNDGFGYDPIFYIPHLSCCSGELRPAQKNSLSHRALAMKALFDL